MLQARAGCRLCYMLNALGPPCLSGIVSWAMSTAAELIKQRRQLQSELNDLVDRRSAGKTQAERLELVPEAVRITGAMQRVEEKFEKLTGQKMEGPFD